jgi:hypothetical protein
MRKISLTLVLILLFTGFSVAQNTGTLRGRIFNANDNTTLPGANVWVMVNGSKVGASSDKDGFFTIKPLNPGIYTVHISYMGYENVSITNVNVVADNLNQMKDIYLKEEGIMIGGKPVIITPNERRLINPESPSRMTLIKDDIDMIPDKRDIVSLVASAAPDIYVSEDRKRIHFRGARHGTTAFIVDGIRYRVNEVNVPGGAIASMTVYRGGVPAKYGDFTGGVVVIETMTYSDYVNMRAKN